MNLLVNTDRMDQILRQVKGYVDTQDAALGTAMSTGLAALTAGKVDKLVAGAGEKIVKSITFAPELLNGPDAMGTELKIDTVKLSLEDGSVETATQRINLADASGVTSLRAVVAANKSAIDSGAARLTALEAADAAQAEANEGVQEALDNKQPLDDGLTSLAGLTGVGVVKSTGVDSFEVAKVDDLDVKAGEALAYAVAAFDGKNGDVKTGKVVDTAGTAYLATDGANVSVGHANATVVVASIANPDGKSSVYSKNPTTGVNDRLVTEADMISAIDAAVTAEADYYGKFTFYAEDTSLAAAKAKVETTATTPGLGMSAVVFDNVLGKIATAVHNGTGWVWTDVAKAWNNGGWAWVEDLLNVAAVGGMPPSGRIVYATNLGGLPVMDTMPDREATPDQFGLTHNGSGALSLKMATLAQYGDAPVSNALNAANLGYGEGKTIFEKISEIDYTVATQEEVQAILDSVFGV